MAIVKILQYPDDRLATVAEKVTDFGVETQKIIDDMFETHYNTENCAALAATQLDFQRPKHITVIDFSPNKDQPLCLVNGEIIWRSEEIMGEPEGCMSVPGGVYETLKRSANIKVRAHDRFGKEFEMDASGFMAKCIQHELDHLNGTLFIDRVSKLKRSRIDRRISKYYRLAKQK
ncbi:MAG: peptide deformylase [Pseudomonadota bacterium]|nr:peptide deformylase [Pseudomonadota bacterium]